jgi:hypothetical protein
MAVRIRSLAPSGPVLVPLTTGASIRLSPGQVSADLPDVEVANNAKVDKLKRQGVIDVESIEEPEEAEPAAESAPEPVSGPRAKSRKRTASSTESRTDS